MIPETTPKVKADEDLNSSVRWEPAVLFTVKQMGQGEGQGGPSGFSVGLVTKRMAFETNTDSITAGVSK